MKNDDLTKLARWIVPGWMSILAFCAFVAIDVVFTMNGQPHLFTDLNGFLKSIAKINTGMITILIAVAGIPVGFVIYQAYFFLRWNSPFSRDGLIALIPGRLKDLNRSTLDLSKEKLSVNNKTWRKKLLHHPLYEIDHGFKWRYIETLFIQACQEIDSEFGGLSIYSRHRYLHEVVHTLGASIGAIYFGFGAYLLFKVLQEGLPISYLIGAYILVGGFFGLIHYEDKWRYELTVGKKTSNSVDSSYPMLHIDLGKLGFAFPSAQFIATFIIIIFFASPKLNPNVNELDTILKTVFVILVLSTWSISQRKLTKSFRLGNGFWGVGSVVIGLIVRFFPSFFLWVDWPFLASLIIFLIGNLVLFLNRRNANEDMLAIEYYTLRRYLENESPVLSKKGEQEK
jgi:hypothetical protein